MSIDNFLKYRKETENFLRKTKIEHHMFYGPVSDEYFSNRYKILFINMEPYGYEDCGFVNVDEKTLLSWLQDAGNTNTRTVKYSLAFSKVLLDSFENMKNPEYNDLKSSYEEINKLKSILRKIVYYNIRPTSNFEKNQDYIKIVESGEDSLSKFILNELKSLEPNIIIIGGKAGLNAFNLMWNTNIIFKSVVKNDNGIMICSIKHPSRPNYSEYSESINKIKKLFLN